MSVTREDVLATLSRIADPVAGGDIVASGLVRALTVDGGTIRFVMEIGPDQAEVMTPVRAQAEAALRGLTGVTQVQIAMTAHGTPKPPPDLKPRPSATGPQPVPGVRRIIAVASGKGGVGKSTVAANLACALAAAGKRVGLLDADVYGPSQPRMLGVSARPASPDGKTIIPLVAHGVAMMSLGLLTKENEALIWRGPMLMGALQQMLFQVAWTQGGADLDVLIVDLPPGTGDVQLTLAQKVPVTGAVIVSTPQDVALLDARKGIDMFRKLNVPILGLIENMSVHICSTCGSAEHIFGHGGVRAEAEQMGVPLLAEIPLHLSIRTGGDDGVPVVVAAPGSPQAEAFHQVARRLIGGGIV
ncbi:iron-sulfur cluster carrier protein ApbC [Paracoccus sp. p4-l81]|uniref:iron-sulfur cluster carrier protein ApbC n=1 Tax=unclassified Paracoccus (in: a-proteobacteria) TaxID=2688777 RepID=UPI0035B6B913